MGENLHKGIKKYADFEKKYFKSLKIITLCKKIVSLRKISLIKVVKNIFLRKTTKCHIPKLFQAASRNFFISMICGK